MEHLDTLVEIGYEGEEGVDGDGLDADVQHGYDWLIVHVEVSNGEGYELPLPKFSRHFELIGEGAHMPEV